MIVESLPKHMRRLPSDTAGRPVPWFVEWVDGKPDFRVTSARKIRDAVTQGRCWVCGDFLGANHSFPIGPMCAVNRTTAEPPSHTDCAEWSARNCPFLAQPNKTRREANKPEGSMPGVPILRNPGVVCVWTVRQTRPSGWHLIFEDEIATAPLFKLGDPTELSWWREGRQATRAECVESITTGLPALVEVCDSDAEREALGAYVERAMRLLPVA